MSVTAGPARHTARIQRQKKQYHMKTWIFAKFTKAEAWFTARVAKSKE